MVPVTGDLEGWSGVEPADVMREVVEYLCPPANASENASASSKSGNKDGGRVHTQPSSLSEGGMEGNKSGIEDNIENTYDVEMFFTSITCNVVDFSSSLFD